jgi:hypothetical protein
MANEPLALAIRPPDAPNDDEYLSLCAALSQSARGRAFLAEHARRSRNTDNELLLTAIGRIETRLQADASAVQRLRDDLRMLVTAIRLARPEIDAAAPPARAVKLAKLLDLFERRIDAMAEVRLSVLPPDGAPRARIALAESEPARAQLIVLPLPQEPEGPLALVPTPAGPVETAVEAAPPPVAAIAQPVAPAANPLAAIMALSDDERLALFT